MRFVRFQLPAILYAGLIFLFSSLEGNEVPEMPFRFGDKLVHGLEFGLFGMLLHRFFRYPRPLASDVYRAVIAFGVLYAASDELHQLFVPGRVCAVSDFLADCIGLALFAAVSARFAPVGKTE